MEKWKKAVIHLECAANSITDLDLPNNKEYAALHKQLTESRDSEKISISDFNTALFFLKIQFTKSRDRRYHGTAIFLQHEDKYYLITARHVLFDELSANRILEEEYEGIQHSYDLNPDKQMAESYRQFQLDSLQRRDLDKTIFNIIFRVPSYDEHLKRENKSSQRFLMNLGAGGYRRGAYTFSTSELDLAIISLTDNFSRYFANELLSCGYIPITLDDIGKAPSLEGAEVFTVGFPESTAVLGQINQEPGLANWSSSYYSLPIFAFGRVSMLHDSLPYFWTDMSIYPGNSGGPIIENNKLVGIVSAQALDAVEKVNEESDDYNVGIPFGNIIKAEHVLDLLKTQQERDIPFWERLDERT